MEVESEHPLPPVKVEAPNLDYAISMFKLYSGFDGELTATTQYAYQNMILQNTDPTSAVLLECISANEDLHFRTIGKLIFMLGADPKLYFPTTMRGQTLRTQNSYGDSYTWWSGELLLYSKDFTQMIQDNLQLEYITIANYNAALREIEDIYVRAVIEHIILDEKRHIQIFSDMLSGANTNPSTSNGA